jgi:hypothetical protein
MWVLILTLGLVKLPLAALMLWIPLRSDAALESRPPASALSDEGDGGSRTLPDGAEGGGPRSGARHPRPPRGGRWPRRGPHGGVAGERAPSPVRVRVGRRATRVGVGR